MDEWLERMKRNGGSFRATWITATEKSAVEKMVGNAYGWGFSPVNPVNGRRDRNRIPRAMVVLQRGAGHGRSGGRLAQ
jgi:hypothetical protein